MKKYLLTFLSLIGLFLFVKTTISAVEYPIYELGNCRDYQECHLYCAIPENHATCWSYKTYVQKGQVLAESTGEDKVASLGITFPIAELGNCTNINSCKQFCSLTENKTACQSFADAHGLTRKEKLVEKAKEELGCNTLEECRTFCSQEPNIDACKTFANKYHLKTETKVNLLQSAKSQLGCSSETECRTFCAKVENRTKCDQFARQHNVRDSRRELMVEAAKEDLGCTSFEQCKTFCQDSANRDKCRNFGQSLSESVRMRNLIRKGTCETVTQCRQECEDNPDKCPGFPKTPRPFRTATQSGERLDQQRLNLQNKPQNSPSKRLETLREEKLPPGTFSGTNSATSN